VSDTDINAPESFCRHLFLRRQFDGFVLLYSVCQAQFRFIHRIKRRFSLPGTCWDATEQFWFFLLSTSIRENLASSASDRIFRCVDLDICVVY
jgi:hypothetical protein